jgi:hypothetical protein
VTNPDGHSAILVDGLQVDRKLYFSYLPLVVRNR